MSNLKILCHGSTKIIEKPEFRNGNKYNDYGLGFYCTEELEFAKEWACSDKNGRFANVYELDLPDILDLTNQRYNILNWFAILVNNRTFSITNDLAAEAKEYLAYNFLIDISVFELYVFIRYVL